VKACPTAAPGWGTPGEGTAEHSTTRDGGGWTGGDKESGHFLCWWWGQPRWTSPCGDDCRVEGLQVYFSPLTCGPQARRRRWPHGQGMPSIRVPLEPVGLRGKRSKGQEGKTECTETPPGSGSR